MKLVKYTDRDVIIEAKLVLKGFTMRDITELTGAPKSTISWHLIHPLKYIDFDLYTKVRRKLNKYARDLQRKNQEASYFTGGKL